MRYFPIYVDLKHQSVLVVGGGEQAAQKVRLLLKTEARIEIIANNEVLPELVTLEADGQVSILRRHFEEGDLLGKRLVYAASEDADLDAAISKAASAQNIPVNVVDKPELCTFITPAIVDRDPVTVAIGTEGAAPVLAREIKSKLEAWLPANYGALARYAGELRGFITSKISDGMERRKVWQRLLGGGFRHHVLRGDYEQARQALNSEINKAEQTTRDIGTVSLVGCGPGDPDLLTLKAQQRLQDADVLVVDRLVNPEILEYARRDAERIFVGKTPGGPSTPQTEINRILLCEALKGKQVARLKGGDPFVFGRAAEEMVALQAHGVTVEIVPGITAAHACAASVHLPLTLRERHRVFSVLTGASVDGIADHDWQALAAEGQGFAIYMGVRGAGEIQSNLMAADINPRTSVVIVEQGTLPEERVIQTHIKDLELCLSECRVTGPAIIFVGIDWAEAGLLRPGKVEFFKPQNVVPFTQYRVERDAQKSRQLVG